MYTNCFWCGTVGKLIENPEKVKKHMLQQGGTQVSEEEKFSWEKNIDYLVKLFKDYKNLHNLGVILEYNLPNSQYRADLIITSQNKVLIVELKMWNTYRTGDRDPCEQALDYKGYLESYHSKAEEISFYAAAYLPNLERRSLSKDQEEKFKSCFAFLKGEEKNFISYIERHLGSQEGERTCRDLLNGDFSPNVSIIDRVDKIINGQEEWELSDEQKKAFEAIWEEVEKVIQKNQQSQQSQSREVFIIKGGPGTGKTVLALHLLARALKENKKVALAVTGQAIYHNICARLETSGLKNPKGLIKYTSNFQNPKNRGLDLLIIDEAHRIREYSEYSHSNTYTKYKQEGKEKQIEELINSARIVVFFLDENQNIRPDEVGSVPLIKEAAQKLGIQETKIKVYELKEQLRCAGDDNYITWVEYILGFKNEKPKLDDIKVKINILNGSDLGELAQCLEERMTTALSNKKKARIVAGFCWPWNDPLENHLLPKDIQIGSWEKPWNHKAKSIEEKQKSLENPYYKWFTEDRHAVEVGCIYSVQGFEFDWIGVIWCEDLVWRNGQWEAQPSKSHDKAIKKLENDKEKAKKLLLNTYRVLLTRPREEVVILCLDDQTREFLIQNIHENFITSC